MILSAKIFFETKTDSHSSYMSQTKSSFYLPLSHHMSTVASSCFYSYIFLSCFGKEMTLFLQIYAESETLILWQLAGLLSINEVMR